MQRHVTCWLGLWLVLGWMSEPMARGSQKISFDLYHGYLIVVQGSAGPMKGLHFLVDTGASPTVLDQRLAQKLHLEQQPARVAVLSGSAQAWRTIIPNLEVGSIKRENLNVAAEDLSFIQQFLPVHIDAIVGLDLLGQNPFVIDYASREIRFGPLSPRATTLPLRIKAGLPIVEAKLDQTSVHFMLDTGAPSLVLFGPTSIVTASPVTLQQAVHTIGEMNRKVAQVETVSLGGEIFGKKPVYLAPGRTDEFKDEFDGLIGPVSLGISSVGFDLDRGVLAFSR